jgi:hypothetical protein
MVKKQSGFKYGKPLKSDEMPESKKRLPQYDECLEEFLKSGHSYWEVNMDSLPSKDPRVVLSSLKWRTKKPQFKSIEIVWQKAKIYLKKVENSE